MHPEQHHWNYSDDAPNGPRDWPRYYPVGESQSPINILVDFCDSQYPPPTGSPQGRGTPSPVNARDCRAGDNLLHEMLDGKLELTTGDGRNNRNHYNHHHHHRHLHRRDHLNSVGNEETDSTGGDLDDLEQHLRSPSTSSSNSNNDSLEHQRGLSLTPELRGSGGSYAASNKQQRQQTRYCTTNKKIFLGYPRYLNTVKLSNTGHGWQVDIPVEVSAHTLLCGPALGDREYRLAQFHCHWGATCDSGSEHQVNGRSYSAELHFVHWNCSQFKSAEEASRHKHGLAVLGVFVQALEGEHNKNKHLDKILGALPQVAGKPHTSTQVKECRLDLKKLFPANRWSYATYEGSLTTPPLSECVDWLVFLQPVACSTRQLEQFRQIKCPEGSLIKNCRPVQPVNKRTVSIWTHSNNH